MAIDSDKAKQLWADPEIAARMIEGSRKGGEVSADHYRPCWHKLRPLEAEAGIPAEMSERWDRTLERWFGNERS